MVQLSIKVQHLLLSKTQQLEGPGQPKLLCKAFSLTAHCTAYPEREPGIVLSDHEYQMRGEVFVRLSL